MRTFELLGTAQRGLTANLGRSILTITGIIIGVGAIVMVVSLGQGAQALIISQVQGVGGDTLVVRPGRAPEGPSDFADTLLSDSLKRGDVEALQRSTNVPYVRSVVPAIALASSASYHDAVYRPTILGWKADAIGEIFQIFPSEGSFFTDDDIRARANVAIIGSRVREELFGDDDALGKTIKVKNRSLRVVGILPQSGQVSFFNPDELVVLPYTIAQEMLGIDYYHEILIQATEPDLTEHVANDIRATLRERHHISDPAKDDFFVVTQQDILKRISTVTQVLTIFLASIAAISLIVGGVGIMNIMLVSVTERTREIGLRKAVGATNADILKQFLFEALLLTISGGMVGTLGAVALASGVAWVARQYFNVAWPFSFPLGAVALGIGMATLVGITFGLYPATRAARKSPIEALRYE